MGLAVRVGPEVPAGLAVSVGQVKVAAPVAAQASRGVGLSRVGAVAPVWRKRLRRVGAVVWPGAQAAQVRAG